MYAIVRLAGRQYRVEPGKVLDVEKLPYAVNENFTTDDVLLVGDGDKTQIGQPKVAGAAVSATVLDTFRGKKIIVFKYRQRTRHFKRKQGHRQWYTRVRIDSITL